MKQEASWLIVTALELWGVEADFSSEKGRKKNGQQEPNHNG
jgi:hypothetical protein